MTHPFATVTKGLSEVCTGGTVYVARGTYAEAVTLSRSVSLLGGYDEADWSRNIAAHATILDAGGSGTVVTINGLATNAIVEGFTLTGGETGMYGMGGGVLAYDARSVTLSQNIIYGNHASHGGGGVLIGDGTQALVEANRIYENSAGSTLAAQQVNGPLQGPAQGGGLWIGGPAKIVNNLIYHNTVETGGYGDGVFLSANDDTSFLHNTVVDNNGAGGVGIVVNGADIMLYNNLIVGHSIGVDGQQADWDYNGFYDNAVNYTTDLAAGAHDTNGDPRFINRAGYDYHPGLGSTVLARGLDLGWTTDLEGNPRPAPSGTAPDLGAYEVDYPQIYLPLVLR
jgi:hypothetical protein